MTVDPAAAARVRDALLDSGYTAEGVLARVGPDAFDALARGLLAPVRRALEGSSEPPDPCIRLFLLAEPIPAAALPPQVVDDLVRLGLVERRDEGPGAREQLRARLEVRPYGEPDTDWYLVSDMGTPSDPQHVLGAGGASLTLARITPRTPVDRALDLGCGSGVQVVHAARHARQVTATDLSGRALGMTALTAALSGVPAERLELRAGSLFDPVAGERFDLIVSNPPFVISPGHQFTYRDGGLPADELSRQVVAGAAAHLTPGGIAVVLANWLHREGEEWSDRVAGWVAGTGVSAWIVQRDTEPVSQYAATWLRDAGVAEGEALEEALDEWLDAFRGWGAHAVGFGFVVLVAPHAPHAAPAAAPHAAPWLHVDDLARAPRLPSGDEVAALLAGCAQLAALDVPGLLATPARLADGATITTELHVLDGSPVAAPPRVGLAGSIGRGGWREAVPAPPPLLAALLAEPATPIGERLDAAAQAEGLDPLDLLPTALITLRELVRLGIVRTV